MKERRKIDRGAEALRELREALKEDNHAIDIDAESKETRQRNTSSR